MSSFIRKVILVITIVCLGPSFIESMPSNQKLRERAHPESDDSLILTHVIFRHGNRTADRRTELYPKDPYLYETYHPYGNGELTKAGKRKEFSVGKELRKRYNRFLGDRYYPGVIKASSTDYDRTKMSLQLVLAGLFPPREEDMFEDNMLWQPIPFNSRPKFHDKILLGVLCPNYLKQYEEINNSPDMLEEFSKYKDQFEYISKHTGLNATRFYHIFNLYFGLSTEEEWGFELPEWTRTVWPETIVQLAIQDYYVAMRTKEMRKMATGYFLQKVIEDTKNKIISSHVPGTRMYLYSSHENTLAELLISLNVFEDHIPGYGAFLAFEIHFVDNVYGVKIYYENHTDDVPQLLTIPECGSSFCPLERFIDLLEDYMPEDHLCGI